MSAWAHFETLAGIDPGAKFRGFWLFQLILFALLLPMMVELFFLKNYAQILRSPRWMKFSLYALLVYYGLQFYFFLYWAADHLTSRATWKMFTAGWLLLFSMSAVYYAVRLSESK